MEGVGEILGGYTGWKARLLTLSIVFIVGGMILSAGRLLNPAPSSSPQASASVSNWNENSRKKIELTQRGEVWGETFFRLGVSFLVAMIFASLLRAFFKTMIALAVLSVGVLWFLEHQRMIEPVLGDVFASVKDIGSWFAAQTASVRDVVHGSLPSMGGGLLGFALGLRR